MTSLIDPIRRNLKFGLPKDKALTWNPSGLHVVQFYNTLSIFFPAGERFFTPTVLAEVTTEMAVTDEMIDIAVKTQPTFSCLVPEKREELTTSMEEAKRDATDPANKERLESA